MSPFSTVEHSTGYAATKAFSGAKWGHSLCAQCLAIPECYEEARVLAATLARQPCAILRCEAAYRSVALAPRGTTVLVWKGSAERWMKQARHPHSSQGLRAPTVGFKGFCVK